VTCRVALALGLFAATLVAQYPPGSGYPSGRPPGIPFPRRGKSSKTNSTSTPTKSLAGTLRKLTGAEVVIEAPDTRVISFQCSSTTKFYKNSAEAQPGVFHQGDQVTVEASEDDSGYYHAVSVTWQRAGSSEDAARASEPVDVSPQPDSGDEPPVLRRAGSAPAAGPAPETPRAAVQPSPEERPKIQAQSPPAKIGADDPGPPVLKRGAPARRRTVEPPSETAEAANVPGTAEAPVTPPAPDTLIGKAREAADAFEQKLPNYVCEQMTTRFQSEGRPVRWSPVDVVSAEVVYEDGRERYRRIAVNGKATQKTMEQLGGSWSKGEFGSVLADLFSPATAAEFHPRRNDTIAGRHAEVYNFSVEQPRSHWTLYAPSQMVRPAFSGSVWIEPRTGRVLRIELQARRVPEGFPFNTVESAVDYQYVRLGDTQEFLLPVHAETLSCQRDSSFCVHNVIDFRNYHRYAGESTITYK